MRVEGVLNVGLGGERGRGSWNGQMGEREERSFGVRDCNMAGVLKSKRVDLSRSRPKSDQSRKAVRGKKEDGQTGGFEHVPVPQAIG